MENKILVVLEQRNNQIKKASLETISVANEFSKYLNCNYEGILIGGEINDYSHLGKYNLNKVTHFANSDLNTYSSKAYTKIISEFAKGQNFNLVLIANTSFGRDLAPRIAVKLNAGVSVDVTEFRFEDGDFIFTRPIFAGKALVETKLLSDNKVISLRPNTFKAIESITEINSQKINVENPDLSVRVTEIKQASGKVDVAEAEIIVSGGRGMKAPENFGLIENLADVLNAATGASRAVVDAGWRPHSEQVGQTGKTVSPNLYVAVGISGAIQHLAGMRSSKCIVAINKDKDAPIFQIADYGIVGDAFEILPTLIDEIKKLKAE